MIILLDKSGMISGQGLKNMITYFIQTQPTQHQTVQPYSSFEHACCLIALDVLNTSPHAEHFKVHTSANLAP
jgi:hypothetical protein